MFKGQGEETVKGHCSPLLFVFISLMTYITYSLTQIIYKTA